MKRIILCFILIVLVLSVCVSAQTSAVCDHAELLTPSQENQLDKTIQSLSQEHSFQAVIVTVDSLDGKSPKSFAENFYLQGDYGIGETKDGILLLLAMNSRDWYIATHGQTRDIVTDSDIDDISEEIVPNLSDGNYYGAFVSFLSLVEDEYQKEQTQWIWNLLIALAIGAAIAGIALFFMRRSMNTARQQNGAGNYMKDGSFDLYECRDFYLYSRTTKVRKSQNNSSGSRSGGSSFGGRGGKF